MSKAWACIDFPEHGVFLRADLEALDAVEGDKMFRLRCPECALHGFPGWMRPARPNEAAKLVTADTQAAGVTARRLGGPEGGP